MNYILILTTFFSIDLFAACFNKLPKSQVELIGSGKPPEKILWCKDLPGEPCLCYDGVDIRAAKIIPVMEESPVYDKTDIIDCENEEACDLKMKELQALGELEAHCQGEDITLAHDSEKHEIFCHRLREIVMVDTGELKVAEDPIKKAVIEANDQINRDAQMQKQAEINQAKEYIQSIRNRDLSSEQLKLAVESIVKILGN